MMLLVMIPWRNLGASWPWRERRRRWGSLVAPVDGGVMRADTLFVCPKCDDTAGLEQRGAPVAERGQFRLVTLSTLQSWGRHPEAPDLDGALLLLKLATFCLGPEGKVVLAKHTNSGRSLSKTCICFWDFCCPAGGSPVAGPFGGWTSKVGAGAIVAQVFCESAESDGVGR